MKLKSKSAKTFHISLRFKLAFPVLFLVILMMFIVSFTTYHTVRDLVFERHQSRLQAIVEVFSETIKVPLILNNQQVLLANIEWMAKRPDVLEIRVEDASGITMGGNQPAYADLPPNVVKSEFLGVYVVDKDTVAVAVPITAHRRRLGRVLILFSQQGLDEELQEIFVERFVVAFIATLVISLIISGLTWLAIRPLFTLKQTVKEILAGDLSARARIHSFDEIGDLADAFNEMLARLIRSLDSLRGRTEALEESEEKYRLVVENAGDIIFTFDPDGKFILLNRGFSGYLLSDLKNQGLPAFLSLHTEESRKAFQEALDSVMYEHKPVDNLATTHVHHQTKAEISYLTNLTPVLDHEGELKMVQAVMRDVTELKRIELMKDSLIRDVAHELKTPTAKFEMAVTWFENEIKTHHELGKYKQVVDILKNNTDRLMRTISSIMDLTKIESGMQRLDLVVLDLNSVLQEVAKDLDAICEQKHLKLKLHLSAKPLMMKGDRDMLYRLFVNLIGNSVKFTEIGSIEMKSERIENKIRVAVTDSGIGIEKEELERIFERFVQKTASAMGIGVGLTISRDIVTLHQGKVWAESEGLGKGAVFKVEFPAQI